MTYAWGPTPSSKINKIAYRYLPIRTYEGAGRLHEKLIGSYLYQSEKVTRSLIAFVTIRLKDFSCFLKFFFLPYMVSTLASG